MSAWLIIPLCILTAIAVWAVIELIRAPWGYQTDEGWKPGKPTADEARREV